VLDVPFISSCSNWRCCDRAGAFLLVLFEPMLSTLFTLGVMCPVFFSKDIRDIGMLTEIR